MIALESQLDFIRRRLSGETVSNYRPGPSAEYSLAQIGQLTGLNLLSGYEPRERALARLFERLSGVAYRGPMAAEVILSAIQQSTSFSILDSLVAYWPLAKDGAVYLLPTAGDLSLSLTNNNSVARMAGPNVNLPDAAEFVAASSKTLTGSVPRLLIPGGVPVDVTWNIWVYFNSLATNRIIWSQSDIANNNRAWVLLTTPGGVMQLFASTAGAAFTSFSVASGLTTLQWYMVTIWSNNPTGFVSGALNGTFAQGPAHTGNFNGQFFASNEPTMFGAQSNNGAANAPHDGGLVAAGLWLRDLSMTDVRWLYNSGNSRDLGRGF